jgi:DNA-binding transcriptional MerR regulator
MFRIGDVAKMLGLTPRTIRHYEDVGLIRPGHVGENNYRYYSEAEVVMLDGIAALARLGVPLAAIGELLKGMEQEGFGENQRIRRLLARQLATVEEELVRLQDIREVIRQADFSLELNRDKPLALVKSVAMTLAVNREALTRWEDRWTFDAQAARYDEVTGRYTGLI